MKSPLTPNQYKNRVDVLYDLLEQARNCVNTEVLVPVDVLIDLIGDFYLEDTPLDIVTLR